MDQCLNDRYIFNSPKLALIALLIRSMYFKLVGFFFFISSVIYLSTDKQIVEFLLTAVIVFLTQQRGYEDLNCVFVQNIIRITHTLHIIIYKIICFYQQINIYSV